MKELDRRIVTFAPGEAAFLDRYKDPDTPEHRALLSLLPGVTADSDSSVIKALVRLAHARIEEEAMRLTYDRAVDGGEFDAESRAAMRRNEVDALFASGFRRLPDDGAELAEATRLAIEAIDDEPWERWW